MDASPMRLPFVKMIGISAAVGPPGPIPTHARGGDSFVDGGVERLDFFPRGGDVEVLTSLAISTMPRRRLSARLMSWITGACPLCYKTNIS
jgi:hypothetical protein